MWHLKPVASPTQTQTTQANDPELAEGGSNRFMGAADIRELARLCRADTLERLEANLVFWVDEGTDVTRAHLRALSQPPFAIRHVRVDLEYQSAAIRIATECIRALPHLQSACLSEAALSADTAAELAAAVSALPVPLQELRLDGVELAAAAALPAVCAARVERLVVQRAAGAVPTDAASGRALEQALRATPRGGVPAASAAGGAALAAPPAAAAWGGVRTLVLQTEARTGARGDNPAQKPETTPLSAPGAASRAPDEIPPQLLSHD